MPNFEATIRMLESRRDNLVTRKESLQQDITDATETLIETEARAKELAELLESVDLSIATLKDLMKKQAFEDLLKQ